MKLETPFSELLLLYETLSTFKINPILIRVEWKQIPTRKLIKLQSINVKAVAPWQIETKYKEFNWFS